MDVVEVFVIFWRDELVVDWCVGWYVFCIDWIKLVEFIEGKLFGYGYYGNG